MQNKLKDILKNIRYVLLDMDGTLYMGNRLIGTMDKTLDALRNNGKTIIFLSNNSSRSKDSYVEKLKSLNLFRSNDIIYSSGMAMADFLCRERPYKSVRLLGTEALKKEFKERGIKIIENEKADVCVLSYDTELTYNKLIDFTDNLYEGAEYVATHPDENCPTQKYPVPDVGSFIEMIKTATGRFPTKIIGKPYTDMGDNLMNRFAVKGNQIMMVGDRLNTDIKFGNNCGFYTLFVLTGDGTMEDLKMKKTENGTPDFILNSLNEINDYI